MSYSYCVKQNIVDWNNRVMESHVVRDGIYTLEKAQKCAKELQKRNNEDFSDLDLKDGYRYIFVAEREV